MRFSFHFLVFLWSLLSVTIGFAQQNKREGNEILWRAERPLAWADFKGASGKVQNNEAAFVGTQISFATTITKDQDSVLVTVESFMIKNRSWKLKTAISDYLLKHEQLHFDICELFARKLRKQIGEMTPNIRTFNSEITKMFKKCDKDLSAYQKQYDKETNHSLIAEKQEEWNQKIAIELMEYEAWGNTEVWVVF
jgi:hypothetical protein